MADEDEENRPKRREASSGNGDRSRNGHRRQGVDARALVQAALEQLAMLVNRPPSNIIGFGRTKDGNFHVEAEVVELERVPDTMSILAAYRVEIDEHGDLIAYRRLRRYPRSAVDEG